MISIRLAQLNDAAAICGLLSELGYSMRVELMQQKLGVLTQSAQNAIFVAEHEQHLVGLIGLHCIELLHAPGALGRITALVVATEQRGRGIGQQLTDVAEAFFRQRQCQRIEVTSAEHRQAAHHFYQRQGFQIQKERFIKTLV